MCHSSQVHQAVLWHQFVTFRKIKVKVLMILIRWTQIVPISPSCPDEGICTFHPKRIVTFTTVKRMSLPFPPFSVSLPPTIQPICYRHHHFGVFTSPLPIKIHDLHCQVNELLPVAIKRIITSCTS